MRALTNNFIAFFEAENDYINLKEIKKGDRFYECERGENLLLEALSDAKKVENGWKCLAKSSKGIMELFVSASTEYFGPSFYWKPKYFYQSDKKLSSSPDIV